MFDIGFWELVLIFGLGLMFLGPERLPRVANQVGRWVGKARRTASQLRRQLERELDLNDLTNKQTYSRPKPPPPPSSVATESTVTDHTPPDHAHQVDEELPVEDDDASSAQDDHASSLQDDDLSPQEESEEPTAAESSTGSK